MITSGKKSISKPSQVSTGLIGMLLCSYLDVFQNKKKTASSTDLFVDLTNTGFLFNTPDSNITFNGFQYAGIMRIFGLVVLILLSLMGTSALNIS